MIICGKGDIAIDCASWLLKQKQQIDCIVPVIPEPKWSGSFAHWAAGQGIPVVTTGNYHDIPEKFLTDPFVISIFYDKIFKKDFIKQCDCIINMHNGPLPKYRGVSPINWALKNGEKEHGVTIHEITPGIDDGPIYGQVKFSIYPDFDEVIHVYRRCLSYGLALFKQTIPRITEIVPYEQDESKATYYNKEQNKLLGDRRGFTRDIA